MLFSIFILLIVYILDNQPEKGYLDKICRWTNMAAVISFIWGLGLTWIICFLVLDEHIPFGIEESSVGTFVHWQLMVLLFANVILLIIQLFRYEKYDLVINWGWFVSVSSVYLTVLFGDLLHRFSSEKNMIESLSVRTVLILAITGVSLMIKKMITYW